MKRETRVFVGFAGLAGFAGTASANPCADIEDAAERLACYDREFAVEKNVDVPEPTAPRPADPVAPTEPMVTETVPVAPVPAAPEPAAPEPAAPSTDESFGRPSAAEAKSITSVVVEKQTDGRGVDYFRLENGQVWKENRDYRVSINEGQTVRIEKGPFNSYNLKSDTINKLVKVRRVN